MRIIRDYGEEGSTAASIPVRISGGDKLSSLAMTLQLGDGGDLLGGTEPFSITGFDFTSSLFDPAFFDLVFSPPGTGHAAVKLNISPKTSAPGFNAIADGLIGYVLIDITPADAARAVELQPTIVDSAKYPFLITKAQDSSLNSVPLTFSNGQLSVVLPEPGAISIIAIGTGLALRRRRSGK